MSDYEKILVVYNPISGKKRHNIRERIAQSFARYSLAPTMIETDPEGDYSGVIFRRFDLVVIAGGDGTVNQVVTHLLRQKAQIPIAIIPVGSANLLASFMGIPPSIKRAVDVALSYKAISYDVAVVNREHCFLVAMGIGYDAIVMNITKRSLKRLFGFWAYAISMLQELFHVREANFDLNIDGSRVQRHAKTIFIMNIGRFFKIDFGPKVSPMDGRVDTAVVRPVSPFDIFKLFIGLVSKRFFIRGRLEYFPSKRLKIHYDKQIPVHLDGEVVKITSPIEIVTQPRAISIVSVHPVQACKV
ncbi:MAG TPA: YegS/Rv2252/BmrU family lipid kinase [Patescibacteria group bacterium]|nr:YegS/Rv2252/BmrU family lipid kinase [Patescibacteria group bacterium]